MSSDQDSSHYQKLDLRWFGPVHYVKQDTLDQLLSDRELIKANTREIDLDVNLDIELPGSCKDPKSEKEMEEALKIKTKECLKVIEEVMKSVDPESIYNLRWRVGMDSTTWDPFDLFHPTRHGYATHAHDLLQTVSTFKNLNTFQYFSRDVSSSRFEDEISKVAEQLPNLEILVIARLWSDTKRYNDLAFRDGKEEETSKLIGERLSTLTKLKQLHFQGLVAPRASWAELDWKSPLEYLKVAECTWLRSFAVFTFAHAFRKTILGISIGEEQHLNPHTYTVPPPDTNFKEFEVLEELQVLTELKPRYDRTEKSILDNICQAPKLKHLHIHFDYSAHLLPHIKGGIEHRKPIWPSLQTLVVTDNNSYKEAEYPPFKDQEKNIIRQKKASREFGSLHAAWQKEDKRKRDRHRYCKYARMTLPNGRGIKVKAMQVVEYGDRGLSLEYRDENDSD